ncbi:MAG: hypothetical protein Q8Q02_13025 [Nocardioides sp.]|nr:hypothetical protein [Nocardioides sp.]
MSELVVPVPQRGPARPGAAAVVQQLRDRVAAMEGPPARVALPTHPALADAVPLYAGSSYGVDSPALALALMAGASAAGSWTAVVGWPDFGALAAVELGVDLARTVLVPDPGEHWLEVAAALVDVVPLVVLRPGARVDAKSAGVLDARLRKRSAVLVVWGEWPRCEARLTLEESSWSGPVEGRGRLHERRARLAVRRGSRPPVRLDLAFPGEAGPLAVAGRPAAGSPALAPVVGQ